MPGVADIEYGRLFDPQIIGFPYREYPRIGTLHSGGVGSAQKLTGVNLTHAVIQALERKVQYMCFYRRNSANEEMATL